MPLLRLCFVTGSLLTDPQIHSVGGEGHGVGNLGRDGISLFLNTHNCNPICSKLNLQPLGKSAIPQGSRAYPRDALAPHKARPAPKGDPVLAQQLQAQEKKQQEIADEKLAHRMAHMWQ